MTTMEFTSSAVARHNSIKDLYLILHDKVYDCSSFVTDHPGGEEFLVELAGQDATEAFEGASHSDGARNILEGLCVGNLKRTPGEPVPSFYSKSFFSTTSWPISSDRIYVFLVLIGALIVYTGCWC
ncbi:cytochrome b5 [Penicillium sp. IBT 31633x]|nr:cytochrome b5 [Penicillium sp. IBT 31633x]